MERILLYSGGVDSWLINQIWKPDYKLYIDMNTDYGREELKRIQKYDNENLILLELDLANYEMENRIIPLRNLYLIMQACNVTYDEDIEICLGATVSDSNTDKSLKFLYMVEDLLNYIYNPEHKPFYRRKIKLCTKFKNKSKTDLLKKYLEEGGDIKKAYEESFGQYHSNMNIWEKKKFWMKFVAFYLNNFPFPELIEKEMYNYFKDNELQKIRSMDDEEKGHSKYEMLEVYKELENKYKNKRKLL